MALPDDRIRELIVAYLHDTKPMVVDARALFVLCKRVAKESEEAN